MVQRQNEGYGTLSEIQKSCNGPGGLTLYLVIVAIVKGCDQIPYAVMHPQGVIGLKGTAP